MVFLIAVTVTYFDQKKAETLNTGVGYCVAAAKSNYERRIYATDEKTAKMVEQAAIADCTRLYGF